MLFHTGIHTPMFPFPAGFNDPPVHLLLSPRSNWMQELADRRANRTAQPQLWMALLNVYPVGAEVNYFFGAFAMVAAPCNHIAYMV
jgi:hypothetical protein